MKASSLNDLQSHLARCPFCDQVPKLESLPGTNQNWWRVRCVDYLCGGTTWAMSDPQQAVKAWNRRPNDKAI